MRSLLAVCALSLGSFGCSPDLAPFAPSETTRSGPGDGKDEPIIRDTQRDGSVLDAADRTDGQVESDGSRGDAAFDDAESADGGIGCAAIECMPGFECCPFDGRCNPVSCFDCCSSTPDAGPDA